MSVLLKQRLAQTVMTMEFEWNFNDTMVASDGIADDFGVAQLTSKAFDVIGLPVNAVIVGGGITVKTAFDTAGYDVLIGDSAVANRYLASTDIKALGYTPLVPTGFVNVGALPIRLTFSSDDVCTTGNAVLRVEYVIAGRASEVAA